MASKFLLLLIFALSYHAHAEEDATTSITDEDAAERLRTFSDCEDSFNCASEKKKESESRSFSFGGLRLGQLAHKFAKAGECPMVLMSQYLKDCETVFKVDSTREAMATKCKPIDSGLKNEDLEKQLRMKFGFSDASGDNISGIPYITGSESKCTNMAFTTEPFDNDPLLPVIRTLPKDQHQAFITEYYSNAHRLKQRMKSQINNIHSIDRILGSDKSKTSLDCGGNKTCDEDEEEKGCIEGEIISGLKAECETLQGCSLKEDKGKLKENQKQLAKKTIYSLQAYYMNAEKIQNILNKCVKSKLKKENEKAYVPIISYNSAVSSVAASNHLYMMEERCKKEHVKELTPLREVEAGYLAMHPWIRSSKFQNKKIKNKIKELDLSKVENHKNIPDDLIEQVKKSMIDQLKETREVLVKEMPRTNKTYNCLIKNEKCENIEGGFIDIFDGGKRSNINTVLNSSPPITNVDEVPDLIPHFENLQCRQDIRINQEAKQEFATWGAVDAIILAGGAGLSLFTFGGSGALAASLVGARFARLVQVVNKANQLKKATKGGGAAARGGTGVQNAKTGVGGGVNLGGRGAVGGAEIFASGVLMDRASAECKNNFKQLNNLGLEKESIQLEVALDEKNNSNKTDTNINQCQVIKKYADIESNMKNCIFQFALAGVGIALPVGIFLKQPIRNIFAKNSRRTLPPKKPMATKNPPQKTAGAGKTADAGNPSPKKPVVTRNPPKKTADAGNPSPKKPVVTRNPPKKTADAGKTAGKKSDARRKTKKTAGAKKNGNINELSADNLNKFLLAQHRVPLKNSSLAGLNKRVKGVRKGAARLKRGQTPKTRNAPKETPNTVGKNVSPTIKNSQVAAAARSVNNSDSVAPVVQNTMQKFPLVAAASRGVTGAGRLLSQYNKSGKLIVQPTARLIEKANRATASISNDKKDAGVGGGAGVGGAAAVNKQVKVNSLDDCSKVKKGSYGYQICALQSRITHLNEKIAQAHVISQRLSLYLWSGVRHSAISPYFISELEIFLKNKKLATVEYQHLSKYMKNISIIQNRINENPNREAQNKMDQLLINFDQYIRNPAQQNLDNSQNLREEISLLDQLTRNS